MDKKWWTLLAVCAATFMLLLDITIVNVALPNIETSLKANFGDVQWVVDAYALTLASLLLVAGSLADRYGRRKLFSIGLVVFTVGSALCGAAQSPLMLILSRSAQGIGGAVMFATSLALLGQSFRGKERGTAFGVWGSVVGISTALGPILGGLITSGISWRGIFLVNIPVGVIAVTVTLWKVDESKAEQAYRPDWLGAALLTGGLVGLVYGLIRASETSWGNSGVPICLAAGVILLTAFLLVERKVAHPLFDLTLFHTPTFIGGSIAAAAMNGSLFAMFLYLVLYLQDVLRFSALGVGLRLLVLSATVLVVATVAGRVSSRVPVRLLIGPGLLLVGIGLLLMARIHPASHWTHLIPGFIVAGVGTGMVNPPLASTAIGVVEQQRAGMASGINTTFRQVGLAASIAALGSVFASSLARHLHQNLSTIPTLAERSTALAKQVESGQIGRTIAAVPAKSRATLARAITAGFVSGINEILVIAAVIALVGAVFSVLLIRTRDFVSAQPRPPETARTPAPAPA